jgi:lysylphosphatidylglycerol synthetase-like protein (DUF2156 family)
MVRHMAHQKTLTPGYVVTYPNRDKATSKVTKLIVVLILLASVALMLIITVGGWSKLQGMKPVNLIVCVVYLILAYYVWRWNRGSLPIAAALAILLLMVTIIAGTGVNGTSWFDRNSPGFAAPHTIFGNKGLGPDVLGALTLILAPVQVLLIVFAMRGFAQGWNVEVERPKDEVGRRGEGGGAGEGSGRPEPAPA